MPNDDVPPDETDKFDIPWRPERITHDRYTVRDEDGEPVTDEDGNPVTAGGGSTIKGYTRFDLTSDEYDRDTVNDAVEAADDWGPYVLSEWEAYNQLVYDTVEGCPFEVRVLPERVAIDVKASTTSESVRAFVDRLSERTGIEWTINRDSERIAA